MEDVPTALFEHQFWLQIMGDHARFIFYSLSSNETGEVSRAESFFEVFDKLLVLSRKNLSETDSINLNQKAFRITNDFRAYQLQLLALILSSNLKIGIDSTILNNMINELDEYLFIMNTISNGQNPLFYPIHYHLLWLSVAIGHAAAVASNVDESEQDFINESAVFQKSLTDLYMKSIQLNGYMKTKLNTFPAMERFNKQAEKIVSLFMNFLINVRDLRLDGSLLGNLLPLTADHMSREVCYYLLKLSMATEDVKKPDCNPASPRIQP